MKHNEIQRSREQFHARARAARHEPVNLTLVALCAAIAMVALALILSLAIVKLASAASPTASGYWPVCVTVGHGTRIEFPQTKRGYAERIKRGAHPARFKAGQWVCSYTGKGAK